MRVRPGVVGGWWLQDIFLNLVFAGHETTAAVLLTLLRELPRHPDVMARLRAEQEQVALPSPSSALLPTLLTCIG